MSERVDRFCNNLRDHLNAVEGHLGQIKQRLDTSGKESRAAIETKVGEAKAKLDAQRQKVDKAKADAKNRIEEKKAETTSKIEPRMSGAMLEETLVTWQGIEVVRGLTYDRFQERYRLTQLNRFPSHLDVQVGTHPKRS